MRTLLLTLALLLAALPAPAGDDATAAKVYVVATSHLDTQWRWTIQTTIGEYLRDTLEDNFALLEKYPDYVFNFEGAFRYQLMKEYYPAEYARLKQYIDDGRWQVCGSWVDAVDVNVPAPESLIRSVLYGNGWFASEFGKRSVDVFLPDCFGFGYALPSVMAHCGLTGFSSQKLTWGSAVGVPFDLGVWRGVDGSEVVAALNPGAYDNNLTSDVSRDSTVAAAVARTVAAGGPPYAMKYYGTGDVGGAPSEPSVKMLEQSLASDGPVQVISAGADQLFREITPAQIAGLPRYDGELLMTSHGAGCYTSQATMKRWHRRNEVLADAAERAATLAWWLGAKGYPHEELERAWTRFLWHAFHDDLTGTSIPEAYTFSWNDELLSQQEFAQVLTDAVAAVARGMDTEVTGEPVVVFNPLGIARTDLLTVAGDGAIYDGAGQPVRSQVAAGGITFAATVPANGLAVYDLRRAAVPGQADPSPFSARPYTWDAATGVLENPRYRLRLTPEGLVSLFDKQVGRELLAAPPRLQLLRDEPMKWAAWEVDYDDLMAAPYAEVPLGGVPVSVEIGDAMARLTFRHEVAGSIIEQTLTVGTVAAPDRLEWDLAIDWRTPGTLLKAAFFPAARDTQATYDLGLGVIERGLNRPLRYEVPAQRWADVTDASGAFGLTVMTDSRYGWDRPDAGTLRLSLIHTPAINDRWKWVDDQKSMDLGRHRIRLGMMGHGPSWHPEAPRQADALNQPLIAFTGAAKHGGPLGREISLLNVGGDQAAVRAVKKAEDGDRVVVRLQETAGRPATGVTVAAAGQVRRVSELRGDEVEIAMGADVVVKDGVLTCDLKAFQPRTFALELAKPEHRLAPVRGIALDLPWNLDAISDDAHRTDGAFDGDGHSLPSEVIPAEFVRDGVTFRTGPRKAGEANLMRCEGQVIALPKAELSSLQLIVCAIGEKRAVAFGDRVVTVPDGTAFFGQWDSRIAGAEITHDPADLTAAYVNELPIGWVVTHRHDAAGENEPYVFTHFYRVSVPVAKGARSFKLPDDPRVVVLAASLSDGRCEELTPASPLVERPDRPSLTVGAAGRSFVDELRVPLASPNAGAAITYRIGDAPDQRYDGTPVRLTDTAILTASVTAPGFAKPATRTIAFTRVEPWPIDAAAPSGELPAGLKVRCYEGAWEKLPDFAALTPLSTLAGEPIAIPATMRAEDIGLQLEGWLLAPARGVYRLCLASDDGSRLWLDGKLVVDNDGLHGASEIWFDAPLDAGPHSLRVEYFQRSGGRGLYMKWVGPGVPLQEIPVSALGHRP
jgi:alpha-mannosidase